ncbi:unnamed protein product [Diamesa hyperborea]
MKKDIITNCKNPATTTTTTTTTTQNPMEVELEAIKNELAASSEELQKEKSENLKVKNERDALMTEKGALATEKEALMKEKDDLKMELINKTTKINELTDKFEMNCKQPTEAVEALDVKLNVMMKHLIKESKDHQQECNEIIKLRAELVTAKEEQKMANDQREKEQEENLKVINERDQLKKENADLNETINIKLPKMEQTIEDFYMEVMDLKIERHYQREDLIALRSKLMEVNEQLAEFKNE